MRGATKHYCARCCAEMQVESQKSGKQDAILRALGLGPRNLMQLATGVYGSDAPVFRKRVSAHLKLLQPAVERVPDRIGLWRLANVAELPEAAE